MTGTGQGQTKEGLFNRMGGAFSRWAQKYMPDPGVFAVVLTVAAFLLALGVTHTPALQVLSNWYAGFWELLAFGMQIAVMIITGGVLAETPTIQRGMMRIARIPKSGAQAAMLLTFLNTLVSYVHTGLSLVASAIVAKYMAKSLRQRGKPVEYSLLVACAYVGQMTWCFGLSSTVGLTIATPGHFLESEMGVIPFRAFLVNPMNIFIAAGLLILLPVFAYLLHPKGAAAPIPDYALPYLEDSPAESGTQVKAVRQHYDTVGEKLSNSRVLCWILAAMGLIYIIYHFVVKGFSIDFNLLNTLFMFMGLLLHGNLANYFRAFSRNAVNASGVIAQYPLYAGIMGIIKYSGLTGVIAGAIVSISTPGSFYFWTFVFASIVNMFVPAGGGQWAVQGAITAESAKLIGADVLKASMCVAYGNCWTNMAQPFWALAVLGVSGLKAKDIMGYSMALMLLGGIVFFAGVIFFPV